MRRVPVKVTWVKSFPDDEPCGWYKDSADTAVPSTTHDRPCRQHPYLSETRTSPSFTFDCRLQRRCGAIAWHCSRIRKATSHTSHARLRQHLSARAQAAPTPAAANICAARRLLCRRLDDGRWSGACTHTAERRSRRAGPIHLCRAKAARQGASSAHNHRGRRRK